MCGICGFNWRNPDLAAKMSSVITHRGPDQSGVWCDDNVSLAHRRLSIIDLSDDGRQPMSNEDGTLQVVFNGEIYNFAEIREELEKHGHRFKSKADTEVILHGYEQWGFECVKKFIGMFAFALWDAPKKRLWIVRDRIGVKPLYWYHKAGRFVFGSEIKCILEDPEVERKVNHAALYAYLGFEFVPAPDTAFEDIHAMPAGHWGVLENGNFKVERYWDIGMPETCPVRSEGEMVERIRSLIDDAVRLRLVSDVPLGAFLSGGLDSSTIVAMMRKHNPGRLQTFTIGYEDKTFSEMDYAQQVADVFQTDHKVLIIDKMDRASLEKSIWHLDEPMTDLSSIPLMFICQKAKQYVTVCLSGEGGDEVFVGYDRFKAAKIASFFNALPDWFRRGVVGRFAESLADRPQKKGAVNMFKRFVEGALLPEEAMHLRWQYFMNKEFERNLFAPGYKALVGPFDPFRRVREHAANCASRDVVNREAYLDTRFMMTDSVLMKADKMSMASSLEIRVPLLDHRLVEYMGTVPGSWKLKGLTTKYIFRKALDGILPKNIVWRGKQGYSLPVKNLLRTQLKDYMIELLHEEPLVKEDFDAAYIDRLIDEHLSMKQNHNHVLWGLMNIAIWHRRFFTSEAPALPKYEVPAPAADNGKA
ncbi:MAG: asparagine synthase (glutamine-hydrolyzing) [Kiritimatiellae bacterium]|nr:asparagine synthase (glutamine-hydrolyzing) [Kiritimatiellia bacterium]